MTADNTYLYYGPNSIINGDWSYNEKRTERTNLVTGRVEWIVVKGGSPEWEVVPGMEGSNEFIYAMV